MKSNMPALHVKGHQGFRIYSKWTPLHKDCKWTACKFCLTQLLPVSNKCQSATVMLGIAHIRNQLWYPAYAMF